ncbi:hypothetical protein [Paracoccus sp. SCSIO 75233]|uniref:hypothetical protein n=1 Tax=Paracoccus sp. SCSIO 75233 TaxID=3017782 RepID=UPI0022F11449|nr:hypothetical protein [Paracoccus sp. SCSIO 75233]WBU55324.1 hypothetical protein PAF12_18430 [Paracoccus sp. SCSIO 75233]
MVEDVTLGFTAGHLEIGKLRGHLIARSQIAWLNGLKEAGINLLKDHPEKFCDLRRYWIDMSSAEQRPIGISARSPAR